MAFVSTSDLERIQPDATMNYEASHTYADPGVYTAKVCVTDDDLGGGCEDVEITVVDTTPPVIDPHADVTEEATDPTGATVSYVSPATSDAVDGAGTATCLPASNTLFALGTTPVNCNATDAAGNPATTTTFDVIVEDTTPPVLTVPDDITKEAEAILTSVDTGDATATDAVGPITITDDAPTNFPVGTTTITWTATDGAGTSATVERVVASFGVQRVIAAVAEDYVGTIGAVQVFVSRRAFNGDAHIDRNRRGIGPAVAV